MKPGQKVEILEGSLAGKKAVIISIKTATNWNNYAFIEFEWEGRVTPPKPQWCKISNLKTV